VHARVRAREGASEQVSIRIFAAWCSVWCSLWCSEVQCGVQCAAVCAAVCVAASWSSDRSLGVFKQVRNFSGSAFISSLTLHANEHAASHHNIRTRAAAWSCACQSWVLLPWDHQLSAVPMVPAGPLAEPMLHHWPEATVCILVYVCALSDMCACVCKYM